MSGSGENGNTTDGEQDKKPAEQFQFPEEPGGILSDSDRRFLIDENPRFADLGWEGDTSQKWWRIRNKIKSGLWDFQLLSDLDDSQLELILEDVRIDDSVNPGEFDESAQHWLQRLGWGEQYYHLLAMMVFLHRACEIAPVLTFDHLVEETERLQTPTFRRNPATGTRERAKSIDVTIDRDVTWEPVPKVVDIEAKREQGEPLTLEEIGKLAIEERIEPGDLDDEEVMYNFPPGQPETTRKPVVDPSIPRRPDTWEDELRDQLPQEMSKKVDWDAVERSEDVWEQLQEHYDEPINKAVQEGEGF